MRNWLFKSEPSTYSIDDLRNNPQQTDYWDGIRNYQARNLIRDDIKSGDKLLFYHSSAKPTGVAGTARVVREAYPDPTAWDEKSPYFDPRSTPENPVWFMVDICFEEAFPEILDLPRLRKIPELKNMMVLRRGMRLSIQPVTEAEFKAVVKHGKSPGA